MTTGSSIRPGVDPHAAAHAESAAAPPGKTDLVSVLYVLGGIPAIVGFLVLLFAIGVRYCDLPA